FFFSSRRRHTRWPRDWSSDVCSSDLPGGHYLAIDSSVFNITTANDPALPREIALDASGRERFRKYVPFESFVNTIEDYPYPYIKIGRASCRERLEWRGGGARAGRRTT